MEAKEIILIAGGTGLIGAELHKLWKNKGHEVRVLSRSGSDPSKGRFQWDPVQGTMDESALENVTVLVNLTGTSIAGKRWSAKRKKELIDSRIGTTECLWKYGQSSETLKHYISASGIICYGFDDDEKLHTEDEPFGKDFLSVITEKWEVAADLFREKCPVAKVRTSVVLSAKGGALPTIAAPVRFGFGSKLGSGEQSMPWIHIDDLARMYDFIMENRLFGPFNANAGNTDNKTLTKTIAKVLKKPLWLPGVPGGLLKLALGEMASVVLDGLKADNALIRSKGFEFNYSDLEAALREIYRK